MSPLDSPPVPRSEPRSVEPCERATTLVIVPAFNEESALGATLSSLLATSGDFDVLVVDDGSSDATSEVAEAHGVTVARLVFNLGIGGALRTGFRYAVEHGYRTAVQFDADGQHDPSGIAVLLGAVDQGADLAVGSRFRSEDALDEHDPYDVGRVRAGAMAVLRFVISQLAGQRLTDTSSGYRAFSRPMLEYFATTYPIEYMESVEALLLACSRGFVVREVPVIMHERAGGRPSQQRLKLLYHFCRLLVVLAVSAPRRRSAPVVSTDP